MGMHLELHKSKLRNYAEHGVYPNYRVSIALVRENADGTETHPELLKGVKFCFYGGHIAEEAYDYILSQYKNWEKMEDE